MMFALLAGYVLWAGLHGQSTANQGPALPETSLELVAYTAISLLVFAAVFAVAWLVGRPSKADLYAAQKIQILTFVFGLVWSFALRAMLFVLMMLVVLILVLLKGKAGPETLMQFRPKVENLFPPAALADPVYTLLCTTWVSFIVAGLREELWRAGVISSLRALFPAEWPGRRWEWLAVVIAAGLFGIGHLTQGWAAVALTATIGLGLGAILVLRRSLPEAVIAHGFFDALTFAALAVITNQTLIQNLLERLGVDREAIRQLMESLNKAIGK